MALGRPKKDSIELVQVETAPAKSPDVHTQPLGLLIALEVDGIDPGKEITTESTNFLDQSKSRIFGKRAHAWYVTGANLAAQKHTDDKIIIGYTAEGLPFQIVVNGSISRDTESRDKIFAFINLYVRPLMDLYAEQLSQSDKPDETIKKLISNIDNFIQRSPTPLFTLSLAITYAKNGELFVAGFGIGDTGLVLQTVNPDTHQVELKQLASTTFLNAYNSNEKDSFGQAFVNVESIINRASVFNEPVYVDDEIFGYTYLFPELLEEEEAVQIDLQRICRSQLSPHNLEKYSKRASLFDAAKTAICKIYTSRCEDAEADQKTGIFGDDCMLSSMIIPKDEMRLSIKEKIFKQELELFDNLISQSDNDQVKTKATKVYLQIKKLGTSEKENLTELTRDLVACTKTLISPTTAYVKSLHLRANKQHQFPTLGRMILAGALIALGSILLIVGSLLIVGGAGLIPTGLLSGVGLGGIIGGGAGAAAGVSLIGTGIGIFASGYHGRRINQLKDKLIETHQLKITR